MSRFWTPLRQIADRITYRHTGLLGTGDTAPLRVEGAAPTVLAFHGFCGVPQEVAVVCDAARATGLSATAPLLAGHGTSAADLAPLRFRDWVDSVRESLAAASREGPVLLAGLSLGSLVALQLALEQPARVAGLVVLGNALWLAQPFPGLALRAVKALRLPDFGFPKFAPDIADPQARRRHTTYPSQPVYCAIDVQDAAGRLREELGRITCPTLILHGAHDRVCPVSNAWRLAERLGSSDVEVRIFPRSRHVLTCDVERPQVQAAIEGFLRRWAPATATHEPSVALGA